ncbi:hypothetical protein QYM36_018779 [Artemia franciscana]|uniref:Uncharacterized protein n=1 Tax=Artemia franciscana TaxID=6661 RepID=A0AA88HBR9_ARTSF|nr:hypothetical protein QYM36_018779 [Artemia franciscana]
MVQLFKTEQVVNEMDNYGLDILALSEVRWTGAGSQTLKKGSTILHSGTEKKERSRRRHNAVEICVQSPNEMDAYK